MELSLALVGIQGPAIAMKMKKLAEKSLSSKLTYYPKSPLPFIGSPRRISPVDKKSKDPSG
jgi:hypothetical protein